MRLMIFTPTWLTEAGEEAMHPACRESIEAQKIDAAMSWIVGRENPWPIGDHRNVLHQYRQARERFLSASGDASYSVSASGDASHAAQWDALLTIEHDQRLPDPGAVQRMLETPGDVVYAPYLLRHGRPVLSTWQYINDRNLGMSLSRYPHELAQARQARVWRVCGTGLGCTLIRRRVLEAIEFVPSSEHNLSPDLSFATTALRAGFVSYGRFDVPVDHFAHGRWLDPFEVVDMNKYIATQTVNVMTAGRFLRLVKGETYDLTEEEARDLIRLAYVDAVGVKVQDERLPEAKQAERAIAAEQEKRDKPVTDPGWPKRRNREQTLRGG